MEGPDLQFTEAVIDNGAHGKHVVRFESGLLARQAAGSATVYLDDDTMLLVGHHGPEQAARRPRLLPADRRRRGADVRRGPHPRLVLPPRGPPVSEGAILTCRLIDRPLRPCFVKGLRNEVQVVVTVMALNPNKTYDVVAINAASLSTQLAGLPFTGPIGGVRVALIGDQWVGFPDVDQLADATFDMVVAGRVLRRRRRRDHDGRGRVHRGDLGRSSATGSTAPTEEIVAAGLEAAKPFIKALCDAQAELAAKLPPRRPRSSRSSWTTRTTCTPPSPTWPPPSCSQVMSIADKQHARGVHRGPQGQDQVRARPAEFEGREKEISGAYRALTKKLVRQKILTEKVRIDGRGLADIRTLSAEVAVVPRVHGSALFQRGETQILGVTTLNMLGLEQKLDTLAPEKTKRYMHNYNFPPYSTGETGRVGFAEAARDRPRCARRAGPGAGAADARGVPVRDPSGVRGARLQRLHLDGLGLRLDPGPAERRCAAARAGRRHRHGSGLRHRRRRDLATSR